MIHHRAAPYLMLLTAVLAGCSKETPPASSPPPAQAPAAPPAATAPPAAAPPAAAALKTGDTNTAGITADVTECRRKEGVLSVKVRFRNAAAEKKSFVLIDMANYTSFYVTATSKKYFILKDSEGNYLTPQPSFGRLSVTLDPGEQYTWWAKYPAPPAEVKAVTLYMPVAPPLEDIPVVDQ